MRARGVALAVLLVAACGDDDAATIDASVSSADAAGSIDAAVSVDASVDGSIADASLPTDAAPTADADNSPNGFVPTSATAELIASGPSRVFTPASWNAHLPKLAGDSQFLYAVHTHFPQTTAERYAAIMRRPAGASGTWTEVARVSYPHQPPGIVMDTALNLHMVFDCLRPSTTAATCFQGGAGTGANTSRFYHLIFSARDTAGAIRFDTYANLNEFTAESNGYHGLGTTSDGRVVWALADSSWQRVVQSWAPGNATITVDTLASTGIYFLYPIIAAHPISGSSSLVVYMGEFDPSGGNNAAYRASTAFHEDISGLTQLFRRAPVSTPAPGSTAAYPSDVIFDDDGVLFALSYLPTTAGQCTELLRFDNGLAAAPTIIDVGCHDTYAKLHPSADGTLYLLRSASGANLRLGVSIDRGTSWTWHDIPITGLPSNGDLTYRGFAPVKPYTSPGIYNPNKLMFTFAGFDASGDAQHSYFGVVDLVP